MTNAPVAYFPDFLNSVEAGAAFMLLREGLAWERRDTAPRSEYWTNTFGRDYTYGNGVGRRTYEAKPSHPLIDGVRNKIEAETGQFLEGCFLNLYLDGTDSLGFHADDDPAIDHTRPILVVTLGEGREIAFKSQEKGSHPETMFLDPGSLLVMQAGMQHTHYHAIPRVRHGADTVGPRISMTFRGLVA